MITAKFKKVKNIGVDSSLPSSPKVVSTKAVLKVNTFLHTVHAELKKSPVFYKFLSFHSRNTKV